MGKRRIWTPTFHDGLVTIPLTRGKETVLDLADFSLLPDGPWQCSHYGYAVQALRRGLGHIYMARVLMNAPTGLDVDHINGDRLDNRRANLRLCTRGQNLRNSSDRPSSSRFKGVSRHGSGWIAQAGRRYVGWFKDETEAARAYNAAIVEWGEFARPNVIP